jgi:hypothetical protein
LVGRIHRAIAQLHELLPAMITTEIESLPIALGLQRTRCLNFHAADRITCHRLSTSIPSTARQYDCTIGLVAA